MSKPIKITDEIIKACIAEFVSNMRQTKVFDGNIKYQKEFPKIVQRATVAFSMEAFAKMMALVYEFESEVAWHAVAKRDEADETRFIVSDVFVYPQEVTGANVVTDQEKYQTWLYKFDDEIFNNMRCQAHSHVRFSTTPSIVDETHQQKILDQLGDDMFYIFMIWNKKMERTIKIFDLKNNILYENADIDVAFDGAFADFIADAKKSVTKKEVVYEKHEPIIGFAQGGKKDTKPADKKDAKDTGKGKKKEKANIGATHLGDEDERDDYYARRYGGYGSYGYSGYGGYDYD